jgi:hypothetical protein
VFTNQVIEYVNLRCELLQAVSRLLATCNSLCTTPPPAIASAVAQTTRDDLHRFGHITTQVRIVNISDIKGEIEDMHLDKKKLIGH